ncbi:MAG: DNA adenine methylase, partial [Ruminococcus sp.]|nr:DNA adenine methylase [Ruminococcus sp.]
VFGGGGSVLFYKDRYANLEVYNDLNSCLVNLFRCAKYHREELQREISGYFNSREMFEDIKSRINMCGFTDIQRAAMFYIQVKISYGSNFRTFGCNRKSLSSDYLEQVEKRLERVVIENKDFENLIKVYDRPKALFYCDQPYHKTENYYDAAFKKIDHERLKAVLSNIKGYFMLSYNDSDYIRELYKEFEIIPVERQNNLSRGSYKELIIKNF